MTIPSSDNHTLHKGILFRGFVFVTIFILLQLFSESESCAQSKIPEEYVKKEKISLNPMTLSLQVGWGFLPIAPEIRPVFQGTQNTTFGGPQLSVQALAPIPWIWDRLAIGVDGWYHRVAKRYLGQIDEVYYVGWKGTDKGYVQSDETVSGFGIIGVADVLIIPTIHLQLGGGGIYLKPSKVDVLQDVVGLTPITFDPAAIVAIVYSITRYEHGSIDVNVRALREFGKYNNLFVQTTIGFAFRF